MKKSLIIIRGIPGAGKSLFANLLPGHTCTADDYHMLDGKYVWKQENAHIAHIECQKKCERLMKMGSEIIKIANTSTTIAEMKPYYELAEKYRYTVFSVIVENRHGGVNEHDVPEETLEKMRNRFNIQL